MTIPMPTKSNSHHPRKALGLYTCFLVLQLCFHAEPCNGFSAPAVNGDSSAAKSAGSQQLQIAFVTGNEMKARELNMILAECTQDDVTHRSSSDDNNDNAKDANDSTTVNSSFVNLRVITVDLPEIQEVNTEAIAKEKALLGAQLAGGPCVVEDTSLQFTALGGMPGPYIKWFQERLGSEGLYNILTAYEDKSAQAVCTLAFCPYPHADPVLFTGVTHGTIVKPVPGRGFGWDSIFVPDNCDNAEEDENCTPEQRKPFSLMTTEEKNQKSHRGKAVRQWAAWLRRNQNELWERQGGRPAIGHKGLDFKCTSVEE
ncbi:Inosine triphosphate pyrophosphatase [Seminavis robusta]|uniref:Inosine triphosphate pyrophosphatase n=1 Tax=Seminavis robusta TaxID=568900 RepID=A0A9N8H5R5_9STRA|nr:Inosine triphosphate pyrophosphatase [Seminavis robusta]|eukprot:Sro122_g059050.1 Inosine triphosphate pyrophosphatase (314) ;mRNA; f:7192-8263